MKLSNITLALCAGFLAGAPLMMAQQASVYFGLGTAQDSSNGQSINPLGTGYYGTPKLTGLFAEVGGGFMFTNHFGAGVDIDWRAGSGDYAGLNYRPVFYDFNGIWQPVKPNGLFPKYRLVWAESFGFSANQTLCDQLTGAHRFSGHGNLQPFPGAFGVCRAPVCDSTYIFSAGGGCALGG